MLGWSSRRPRWARPASRRLVRLAVAALVLTLAAASAPARDVTVVSQAVLREKPEALAPVVAVVPASGTVFLRETAGDWAHVSLRDGRSGWVPASLAASALTPDEHLALGGATMPRELVVGLAGALHASPAAGSRVVAALPAGSAIVVESRLGDWLSVATPAGPGWLDASTSAVFVGAATAPVAAPAPAASAAEAKADREAAAKAERERIAAERKALAEQERARRDAEEVAKREQAAEAKRRREAEKAAAAAEKQAAPAETAEAEPAPAPEAAAPAEKPAGDDKAQREAEAAAKKQQAEAEKQQAAAAKKAQAEQAAAEKKAQAEQAAADKAAKKAEADEARRRREADEAAAKAAAKAGAPAAEAPQPEAAPAPAPPPQKSAKESTKEAERAARAEKERLERERIEELKRQAAESAASRAPATPVDIPPAVPVVMVEKKAPNERKRDPQSNPLVREGVPGPSAAPAASAAPSGDGSYQPYDPQRQVARSVEALHADRQGALGLSTGETTPEGKTGSVYVGEDARTVPTTVVSQIVARVNDEILTNAEFNRRYQEMLEEMKRAAPERVGAAEERELRRRVLGRMIEQLLLVDDGKALGVPFDKVYENAKARFMKQANLTDDVQLLQLLEATGRTWDDFRRELLRESVPMSVLQGQVYRHVTVPEDDIAGYYRLHQEDFVEDGCVRLREIVLQPEPRERTRDFSQRLEALLKSLEAGADFCEMARRYSKAPSADDCGLLPQCFTRGQLDEKVALVAFRMKPGDVEPIATDWGYHVIRLEESKARRAKPVEEVRDQIVDRLRTDRANEQVRRYIDRLREAAKIEVAPEYRDLLEGAGARAGSAGQ